MNSFPMQYDWPIKISSFDAGKDRRIKLSSILRLQQEVGELHLSSAGIPYKRLYDEGIVFIASRLSVRIKRAPVLGEDVVLRTWNRDSIAAQFYRCYQIFDGNGGILTEGISSFVMINPVTRRLLRPTEFDRFNVPPQPERTVAIPDPPKLSLPAEMPLAGSRLVRYSEIDYNLHLNNTNYADFITDFMPGGMEGRVISGFSVSFLGELHEGDEVSVCALTDGSDVFYRGRSGGRTAFEACCKIG